MESLAYTYDDWLFRKGGRNIKNVKEKVKFPYNLDSSLDNFIQDIISDMQKLKDSEEFKDYKWLV